MANPLFNAMGNGTQNMPGPMGNISRMMQQFQQFKQTFRGDPKEKVQELLRTGQMSQQQLDQLQNVAKQFMAFMPR